MTQTTVTVDKTVCHWLGQCGYLCVGIFHSVEQVCILVAAAYNNIIMYHPPDRGGMFGIPAGVGSKHCSSTVLDMSY